MRKSNFFIVGSPKAGTTAMRDYLSEHPNIYMCHPKEPHYFALDLPSYRVVKSEEEYNNLFAQSDESHYILGDASIFSLYSDQAIEMIHSYNPDAKILIMLRNPADVAYSFHSQLLYSRQETIEDFEKAWLACSNRKSMKEIPNSCTEPKLLYYDEIAKFYFQLTKVYKHFPSEQVRIILFNDFISNTSNVYKDVLNFLSVPLVEKETFERINENKRYKFSFLGNMSQRPSKHMNLVVKWIKQILGIDKLRLMEKIHQYNVITHERKKLNHELRSQIINTYSEDLSNLKKHFGIDLLK